MNLEGVIGMIQPSPSSSSLTPIHPILLHYGNVAVWISVAESVNIARRHWSEVFAQFSAKQVTKAWLQGKLYIYILMLTRIFIKALTLCEGGTHPFPGLLPAGYKSTEGTPSLFLNPSMIDRNHVVWLQKLFCRKQSCLSVLLSHQSGLLEPQHLECPWLFRLSGQTHPFTYNVEGY